MNGMKRIPIYLLLGLWLCGAVGCSDIDREVLVRRHDVVTTRTDPKSPAQVGNGEFAFGVDITGLQTFVPFNTIAQWGWHSFPLADSLIGVPFEGVVWDTHGRPVRYDMPNETQPELSQWLAGNPHRINLGRIGFVLNKKDGTEVREIDLQHSEQRVDLYHGTIYSRFEIEGTPVEVEKKSVLMAASGFGVDTFSSGSGWGVTRGGSVGPALQRMALASTRRMLGSW